MPWSFWATTEMGNSCHGHTILFSHLLKNFHFFYWANGKPLLWANSCVDFSMGQQLLFISLLTRWRKSSSNEALNETLKQYLTRVFSTNFLIIFPAFGADVIWSWQLFRERFSVLFNQEEENGKVPGKHMKIRRNWTELKMLFHFKNCHSLQSSRWTFSNVSFTIIAL